MRFRKAFDALTKENQEAALTAYNLWKTDPFHPSLHFKSIRGNVWSVRVTAHCRALGEMEGDTITWLWIGNHREYEKRT
jgi:hypothetical protein